MVVAYWGPISAVGVGCLSRRQPTAVVRERCLALGQAVLLASGSIVLCGLSLVGILLGLGLALLALLLPRVRTSLESCAPGLVACFEIFTLVLVLTVTAIVAGAWVGEVQHVLIRLPVDSDRLGVVLLGLAAVSFLGHGGTILVRAVIGNFKVEPRDPDDSAREIDEQQYNRGRFIGALERLVIFLLVLAQAYAAAGLVVTAKGWVRSKELGADRDFAEYFLIGTFTSLLIAFVVAMGVAAYIGSYW